MSVFEFKYFRGYVNEYETETRIIELEIRLRAQEYLNQMINEMSKSNFLIYQNKQINPDYYRTIRIN